jgi:hypothetical protein
VTRQSGLARWCPALSNDQQHLARFQQRHAWCATRHKSREAPISDVLAKLELFRGGHANLGRAIHARPQEFSNPADIKIHTQTVTAVITITFLASLLIHQTPHPTLVAHPGWAHTGTTHTEPCPSIRISTVFLTGCMGEFEDKSIISKRGYREIKFIPLISTQLFGQTCGQYYNY